MITFLHGKLVEALPTQVTVNVNGVGYEALIPLSSYDKLPAPGQEVKLLTHLVVREDAHILYGFMSKPERDLFRLLINTVSGIGPKIALGRGHEAVEHVRVFPHDQMRQQLHLLPGGRQLVIGRQRNERLVADAVHLHYYLSGQGFNQFAV